MKTAILIALAALLTGCAASWQLPPNSCDSAVISLNVGPLFSQHATLTNVSKTSDGMVIGDFNGGTSYLGIFNFQQSAHNLHVSSSPAKTPPAAVAPPIVAPSVPLPAQPPIMLLGGTPVLTNATASKP